MPSVLNVDTLVAANGTDPVTLTKQSAAKAWVTFGDTVSSGNPAIYESFNQSSLTDHGSGDQTLAFVNNMSTAKGYTVGGSFAHSADITDYVYSTQPKQDDSVTTSGARLVSVYAGATASGINDYDYVANTVHGDLA